MSGPKGYAVAVSPQVLRQRELETRRRTWDAVTDQLEELQGRVKRERVDFNVESALEDLGFPRSRVKNPTESDLDSVEKFLASAERVHSQMSTARTRAILAESQELVAGLAKRDFSVSNLPTASTRKETTTKADSRLDPLLVLAAETSDRDRPELISRLRQLSSESGSDLEWMTVTRLVTDSVRRERDKLQMQSALRELEALVERADEPERGDIKARLAAAQTARDVQAMRPSIENAVRAAEHAATRRFVMQQAVEVWAELGYQVDSEFVSRSVAGDAGLLFKEDWPDHALQVRFGPDDSIATNVVAFGASSSARDEEVEQQSCAAIGKFQGSLRSRGVSTQLTRQRAAGEVAVQRLASPIQAKEAQRAAVKDQTL